MQTKITQEVDLAYTNAFGEEMRVYYTPEAYEWRANHQSYSNVRVEVREIVTVEGDWKVVDPKDYA